MEKDNIDKIEEQIHAIQNEEKNLHEKEDSAPVEIPVEESMDDTKKVNDIHELKEEPTEEESTKEEENPVVDSEEEKERKLSLTQSLVMPKIEEEEKPKKNPYLILILCIVVAFVIMLLLIFLFSKPKNKPVTDGETHLTSSEQKKIITGYGEALEGLLQVYYEKKNMLLTYDEAIELINYDYDVVCKKHEIYDNLKVYLADCQIDQQATKITYGKKQEEVKEELSEGDLKIYVSKKDHSTTFEEPTNLDNYDSYIFHIDGVYSDLSILGNKNASYLFYFDGSKNFHLLNFKTNTEFLSDKAPEDVALIRQDDEFDTNFVGVKLNGKWGIYEIEGEKEIVSPTYASIHNYSGDIYTAYEYHYIHPLDKTNVIVRDDFWNTNPDGTAVPLFTYGMINYQTGEEIIPEVYSSMVVSGDYIVAKNQFGSTHLFHFSGKERNMEEEFDKIYTVIDGKYMLVQDGKHVKVVTIVGKDLYDFGEIEVGHFSYGIKYQNGALFQFYNPSNQEECLELIYDGSTKTGTVKNSFCGGIAKPVLYLYPKETTRVSVNFEYPELLNTTYPKYTNGWEVVAHPNGDLYDKNNRYYYALYWDEKQVHTTDFQTGYYVEKEDAISFLESKLGYIGLNEKEQNEFIMYWLPILEKNEKSLVYFELTEERENVNKLMISPKPDSLLRIVIHIKKVEEKVDIPKQNLTRFHRKGFAAVEWGGTIY